MNNLSIIYKTIYLINFIAYASIKLVLPERLDPSRTTKLIVLYNLYLTFYSISFIKFQIF